MPNRSKWGAREERTQARAEVGGRGERVGRGEGCRGYKEGESVGGEVGERGGRGGGERGRRERKEGEKGKRAGQGST